MISNKTRLIYIGIIIVVFLVLLLHPGLLVHVINSENWELLLLVKSISEVLGLILGIYYAYNTVKSSKITLKNKLVNVALVSAVSVYLGLSSFNAFKDLSSKVSVYQGSCELRVDGKVNLVDTFYTYLTDLTSEIELAINTSNYWQFVGDDVLDTGKQRCNSDVRIKYLNNLQLVIDMVPK